MLTDICFQIHNIPGLNKDRDDNVDKIRKHLSNFYFDLNLNTVLIQNEDQYESFIKFNNKFKARLAAFKGSIGDIGAWASYYISAKSFINSEYKYFISIQDEAIIFENFSNLLEKYIKKIPEDADFLYLDRLHSPVLVTYNRAHEYYEINDTIWMSNHWFAGETILFTRQGAIKFINYIEENIIENFIDCILLDFEELPKLNIFNHNGKFMINLTGELPKVKNKRFNSYSLSPSVQPIAGSFRTNSIIRELHLL